MRPEEEFLSVIASERRLIAAHPGWHSGPNRILTILQTAIRRRQSQPDYLDHPLPWETVLGLLITWHQEFPTASGPIAHDDATELVEAAIRLSHVVGLELGSRVGAYHVRKRGKGFAWSRLCSKEGRLTPATPPCTSRCTIYCTVSTRCRFAKPPW